MFDQFSTSGQEVLRLAQDESLLLDHSFVGSRHVLLGIVREGECPASRALMSAGIDLPAMRRVIGERGGKKRGKVLKGMTHTDTYTKLQERARGIAASLCSPGIEPEHLLLAICMGGKSEARHALKVFDVKIDVLCRDLLEGIVRDTTRSIQARKGPGGSRESIAQATELIEASLQIHRAKLAQHDGV